MAISGFQAVVGFAGRSRLSCILLMIVILLD